MPLVSKWSQAKKQTTYGNGSTQKVFDRGGVAYKSIRGANVRGLRAVSIGSTPERRVMSPDELAAYLRGSRIRSSP